MTTPSGLPRINEPAPDFKVNTTHGERSLADYKGKWLVLFRTPPTSHRCAPPNSSVLPSTLNSSSP